MSKDNNRVAPIPWKWCETVSSILRSSDPKLIITVPQADRDWSATFPDAWHYNRFEAMASALETPGIVGRHILDMDPPCDAYEFWFIFAERKLIGKIGLLPDGKIIIVFSSHIPRKGEETL